MLFTKNNNNPKSLSAGSTTRSAGKAGHYPVHKMGQPTPGTKVRPARTPAPKTVEPAKPPKAPNRPTLFVVSKVLTASNVINAAQYLGALKPVAACKPLNTVKRSSAPKGLKVMTASDRLKTLGTSKVLDIAGVADAPKAPPGLNGPDTSKTSATRAAAVEAVHRQINEQKQKATVVTAHKAKAKSEPLSSAKPAIIRDATSLPAFVSRHKAKVSTATANAAENVPPPATPARRPLPAVRKGGIRKPVIVVSRSSSPPSSPPPLPASPTHAGAGCSCHQRNMLYAAARLPEGASLMRRNAIRKLDPFVKPRRLTPALAVQRTKSSPLLGWAKAPAAVTRSTSGPVITSKIIKSVVPKPGDAENQSKVLRFMNADPSSDDEGAVDASKAETDTMGTSTPVGSDDKDTSIHLSPDLSFQISIQDCDVQSTRSMSSMSFSSILDMFPVVPTHIPGPLTQDMHRQLVSMNPVFTADKAADVCAEDSMSSMSSMSGISSILDQFPMVPTYIPSTLTPEARSQFSWLCPTVGMDKPVANIMLAEEIIRTSIISLDGEAPVLDMPAAFDSEPLGGSTTAVGSSVSSREEKAPVVSKAATGAKKWWKRAVGKK
ncbi:hypothetical protein EWM64_g1434 [Hericium alpestre]|uniref:Uncharacterized protein n=1 Tax=Hericium alpestre TaxID=135208 RepID=A0A4Z0AAL4_9AGAM|nr:hypothetical protein EWM64_g1434 [Hericium alpestre]